MKLKNKLLAIGASILFAQSAMAGTANSNVTVQADIVPHCAFAQNYTVNFGTIAGYSVGKANQEVTWYCPEGLAYTVTADEGSVTANGELVTVRTYLASDYSGASELSNGGSITGVGVSMSTPISQVLYFKATGEGIDKGEGNTLFKTGSFSVPINLYIHY